MVVKTRQQLQGKHGHTSHIQQLQKLPIAFGDQQLSARHGTLQCSAGPVWSGCHGTIDTLTSTWAPGGWTPVRVRRVPHNMQKKSKKKTPYIYSQYHKYHKNILTLLAKSQYIMYEVCRQFSNSLQFRLSVFSPVHAVQATKTTTLASKRRAMWARTGQPKKRSTRVPSQRVRNK